MLYGLPFGSFKTFYYGNKDVKLSRFKYLDSLKPPAERAIKTKGVNISKLMQGLPPVDPDFTLSALEKLVITKGIYYAAKLHKMVYMLVSSSLFES